MSGTVTDPRTADPDRPARRRRPPTTGEAPAWASARIDGLDGLRVVAAVGVLTYHAMGVWLPPNHLMAVIIPPAAFTFFLISGFVIYRPFAAADLGRTAAPDTGRFLRSRLVRVLPLWWVALAAYLAVGGTAALESPRDWVATLLLLQYLDPDLRFAVIGPAWALSVEWLFYLAAPAVAVVVARLRRSFAAGRRDPATGQLTVLAVLALGAAAVAPLRPFAAVIVGMALAVVDLRRRRQRRAPAWLRTARHGEVAVAVTVVAWVILARYPYQDGLSVGWIQQDPLVTAVWIVTATAWFVPVAFSGTPGVLSTRPLVWAGQLTFGLYLWHDLALQQVTELLGTDGSFAAGLYLTALASVALALVTFVVVERPVGALRYSRPRSPARAGARPTDPRPGDTGSAPPRPPVAAPPVAPVPPASPSGTTAAAPVTASARRRAQATTTATTATTAAAGGDRRWITTLDGLRVAAAFCVASFHVFAEGGAPPWVSATWAAMFVPIFALFFVMSGFILYRPWAVAHCRLALDGISPLRPPDGGAGNFLLRRMLRIYPLYWVVQGTSLLTQGTGNISGPVDWFQVITLFPLPSFDLILEHGLGIVVWTILLEMTFYLVLTVYGRGVLGAVRRGVGYTISQALPLGIAFALLVAAGAGAGFRLLLVACCLVLGMAYASADAWRQTTGRPIRALRWPTRNPALVVVTLVVAWTAAIVVAQGDDVDLLFHSHLPVHLVVMVVVSSLAFVPAVFGPARSPYRRLLSSRPLRALGPLTFGVYLWHYPVIRVVPDSVELPLLALWAWGLLGSVGMAWLTHHALERPIDALRHRHLGRTSAPPTPAVAERISP